MQLNFGSTCRSAIDGELSFQQIGLLFQAGQAMAGQFHRLDLETDAIIFHASDKVLTLSFERNINPGGFAVFSSVGDGLLEEAK